MPDGNVAAELAAIREDLRVTAGLERAGGYETPTAALRHARRLLAAVEAVLALHAPESRGRVMNCCAGCEDACEGDRSCHEWPCPTVEAITAALAGEEDSGG